MFYMYVFGCLLLRFGGQVWSTGYFKRRLDRSTFPSQRKDLKEWKFPHIGHLVKLPPSYRACGLRSSASFTNHLQNRRCTYANLERSVMVINILDNLGKRYVLNGQAVCVEFGIIHPFHLFFLCVNMMLSWINLILNSAQQWEFLHPWGKNGRQKQFYSQNICFSFLHSATLSMLRLCADC